jgi:holo-[acyl-carrier protein] synthase
VNALGVGLDLVDVARIRALLERHAERAIARLLTEGERAYCMTQANPAVHVAARLAAKEAAFKALSPGGQTAYLPWREFEVVRAPDGVPTLQLHGRARATADRLKVGGALLSLTHTATHAAALVILLGADLG